MSSSTRAGRLKDRFGEQLCKRRARLSPGMLKVLEFLNAHRHRVLGLSALEIGFETGASDATVIRAIQALGFSGLRELKDVFEAWLGETDSPVEKMATTLQGIDGEVERAVDFVLQATIAATNSLSSEDNRAALTGAARLLANATGIGIFGIGASGIIAEYGARLFSRSGIISYQLNLTGIALAEQLLTMQPGHILIMLLHGRAHREAMATIAEAERLGIPIIMVLGRGDSPLRSHARHALVLPRAKSEQVALHATSAITMELLHIIYSSVRPADTLRSLDRLIELRTLIRPNSK